MSKKTRNPRTPKKPEYLLALASYWTGSVGIRSHSIFDGKNRKKNRAGLGLGSFFSTGDPCDLFTRPCRNSSPFGFARREKNNLGRRSRFFFGAFYGHHVWWICHPFSPPNNKPIFAAFLRVTKKEQLHKPRKLGDGSRRNRLFFRDKGTFERERLNTAILEGEGFQGFQQGFALVSFKDSLRSCNNSCSLKATVNWKYSEPTKLPSPHLFSFKVWWWKT